MAIYHLSVKNGSPGMGKAHADYIEREGRYSQKEDFQYSESGNLPAWAHHDAQIFWHAADLYERKNGRPFREIEIALPREFNEEQRIELVRDFVQNTLGERHAYTWAIHSPQASDGLQQPHAHIMFTERVNDGIERDPEHFFKRWNAREPEKGGAGKDRYLSSRQFVRDIRHEWAMTANQFLEKAGIEARIDHRSYQAQGIELEPQLKKGISSYATERGILKEITAENRERAARNGERILEHPEIAFKALTATQSVFSRRDIEQFVFRNSDTAEQYQAVYQTLMNSPEMVALNIPEKQGDYFTSKEMHEIETRLIDRSQRMGEVSSAGVNTKISQDVQDHKSFNSGQADAYQLITSGQQLVTVNGAAGTGKSYVLGAAREAFEQDGFRVIGAALQGKTADDMQRDAGIKSQTIHSLVSQLEKGQASFDSKTVLIIDEAGMVGSRQLEKLLDHAEQAGAKVRLVGDAWQLHAVDAGDAFRHVAKATQTASLTEIMRQKQDWQREASTALSKHDLVQGISAYQDKGFVTEHATQHEARTALLDQWQKDRKIAPQSSQILLAHTNVEREALNRMVREIRQNAGELGQDNLIKANGRSIRLAEGERIMFTQNEYVMQVKNGTMGKVEKIEGDRLGVRLDDGRQLEVNTRHYGHFDYGYAVTIHKSQGVTVDRAYLLATRTMNAELAYVGMTRHKDGLQVAYSREHFKDAEDLKKSLSRAENKTFSGVHAVDEQIRKPETGQRQTLAQQRQDSAPNEPTLAERFKQRMESSAQNTREKIQEQRQNDTRQREEKRIQDHPLTKEQKLLLEVTQRAMRERGDPENAVQKMGFEMKKRFYSHDKPINEAAAKLYASAQKEQEKQLEKTLDKGKGIER